MTKLTSLGCAAVMMCASSIAWAGAETGFYLGGSLGYASSDIAYTDPGIGYVSYDDDDSAYKVFVGYNFGVIPLVNIAIEGSYVDFGTAQGTVSGTNVETTVDGWNAFGLLGVNLGPAMVFAKVGAIDWESESVALSNTVSNSGTDPAYGVGVQLQIKSLGLRAEFEVFDLESVEVGYVSVGLSYTF
jgi:hypothetical protein